MELDYETYASHGKMPRARCQSSSVVRSWSMKRLHPLGFGPHTPPFKRQESTRQSLQSNFKTLFLETLINLGKQTLFGDFILARLSQIQRLQASKESRNLCNHIFMSTEVLKKHDGLTPY